MLIDWFTVVAQVLNFAVLVWLLKRFLYGPILAVVDARDQRIAAELADATRRQAEAEQERNTFQQKNLAFDREREGLLEEARGAAEAEQRRLFTVAREAFEAARSEGQRALDEEAKALEGAITHRAQEEVFAIARKALAELATSSLEAQICEIFVQRLRALAGVDRAELVEALRTAQQPALVRTAFDLPAEQQEAIRGALTKDFALTVPLQFETCPEVVGGIELSANGQKVAWSINEFLRSLAEGVDELIGAQSLAGAEGPAERRAAQLGSDQEGAGPGHAH